MKLHTDSKDQTRNLDLLGGNATCCAGYNNYSHLFAILCLGKNKLVLVVPLQKYIVNNRLCV